MKTSDIKEIILHCTGTPVGHAYTVSDVDRWHRARGWKGIGYHYLVLLDGRIQSGRPENQVGAHCVGHNRCSIGVCYVGGLSADGRTPQDTRTPAQRVALRELVADLLERYPQAKVHGHNEFAAKACPCFKVPEEL